jgi:hypothetical protein
MTKLKPDSITAMDLKDFVASDSDFAFEMKVLAQLRSLEFDCEHSGTYRDPVSDKIRQFDIRATKKQNMCTLGLAVECKNLHSSYPLLLSAVPRTAAESFHDLVVFHTGIVPPAVVQTWAGDQSAYRQGESVGKKTDQVGRSDSGAFVSDDSATFDKLNQAVNSCKDLVQDFVFNPHLPNVRAIAPVLVIPTGLLWQVDYADDGRILTPPRNVDRTTLFLNNSWSVGRPPYNPLSYRLSHIELVTLDRGVASEGVEHIVIYIGPLPQPQVKFKDLEGWWSRGSSAIRSISLIELSTSGQRTRPQWRGSW